MDWLDLDIIKNLFGDAISSQVTQFTIAFTLAAYIHAGRVKKEIKAQFSHLTDVIGELGAALRQDLNTHSERIGAVEKNVSQLSDRIENLESKH